MRRRSPFVIALVLTLWTAALLLALPGVTAAQDSGRFSELDLLALSPEAWDIAYQIQCPVCEGQPITESNATIAKQMKALVQQMVDEGRNEKEILAFFEERYGPAVLREPTIGGLSLGVWVVPPIILLLGLVVVGSIVRQWRRSALDRRQTLAPLMDVADEEAVAREMKRLGHGED